MSELIPLKEYVDQRFADNDKAVNAALVSQEKAVGAALAAAEKAVNKAESSANDRFEAANNVKATFSGDLSRKLDRTEYEANHKSLEEKIQALTDRMNVSSGKSTGLNAGWGYLIAAISLVAVVIGILSR